MPRVVSEKTNFAAGQIDQAARADRGKTIYDAGVAAAKNFRILNGRGTKRRPGAWWMATISNGKFVGSEFVTESGDAFVLVFSNARLDVYDTTGALIQTITGCAWGSSIIDEMYREPSQKQFIVAHHDFWPQVISVDSGGTWSVADFAFAATSGGGTAQPYYNYQAKGVTLQPSGLTGSISLTTSGAHFVAGHVGTVIRYLGKEILITAVTDSTHASGTVVQTLPQTVELTVASGIGYQVDESVQGLDSGAKGIVTGVSGGSLDIVMTKGLTGFTSGETLVGDGGSQSAITVAPSNTTPAAVLDWDEQAFSAVRGYPGGCQFHRGRLYLFDFRDIPRAVTASAAGFLDDFLDGVNDGDAFFELVPEYRGQRVRHVVSADQGIVLTDRMAYYLPEYGTQVITPTTIAFREVAPIGASAKKPAKTERGVMYAEEATNRIVGILASGNVQAPWDAQDISVFWSELITGPRALSADVANTGWAERYGFVVNDDGTIAVLHYESSGSDVPVGWTPWETNGAFRAIFSAGGRLWASAQYLIDDVETWVLLKFDEAIYLDAALAYTGAADTLTEYANDTVEVMLSQKALGAFAVDGTGLLTTFDDDDAAYVAGLDMDTELTLLPPSIQHPAFTHGQRFAIPKAYVHVKQTCVYSLNGALNPAYRTGESLDALPTLRTESRQFGISGRASDLAPAITQTVPSPLQVLGVTMEVSF